MYQNISEFEYDVFINGEQVVEYSVKTTAISEASRLWNIVMKKHGNVSVWKYNSFLMTKKLIWRNGRYTKWGVLKKGYTAMPRRPR